MSSSIKISPKPSAFFEKLRGKTLEELAREQGSRPFDIRSLEHAPEPFYEGFEADIKRLRRGEKALGPVRR